jgi:hypothetical protein
MIAMMSFFSFAVLPFLWLFNGHEEFVYM